MNVLSIFINSLSQTEYLLTYLQVIQLKCAKIMRHKEKEHCFQEERSGYTVSDNRTYKLNNIGSISSSVHEWYDTHYISQHAATRSITQQHAASRSNTQQHAATRSNTQQHAATRSITQHHAASRSNTHALLHSFHSTPTNEILKVIQGQLDDILHDTLFYEVHHNEKEVGEVSRVSQFRKFTTFPTFSSLFHALL